MAIFRVNKDDKNPFMIINKEFVNDNRLSLKAKGLMCYFLSKPDSWEFYIEEIKKHTKDKEAAISSAIKELIEAGYIKRSRKRENGKFLGGYAYDIFEAPKGDISKGYVSIAATTIGQQSYGRLTVNNNEGQAPLNTSNIYEEIQLSSCVAATVDEEIKVTDEKENKVQEGHNSIKTYRSENADAVGTLHEVKNTEMGKSHTEENTDMEFYQNGEAPRWENPVLVNNDFNNKNDFNSNNDIYTSDFKESEELTLAKYLFNHIKNNNPKAKEPNLDKWSRTFKLIIKKDQRDFEEVKSIIDLSQKHHFWYKNILSPEALRKQYDRLLLEMEEKKKTKKTQDGYAGNFSDYKQRTYDFDKLERQLLGWS